MKSKILVATVTVAILASAAKAGPVLWINDVQGTIGTVDVATGSAAVVGNSGVLLADIAFDMTGNLYGISPNMLYTIDKATGLATAIGGFGGISLNSLVFGADGILYGSGNANTNLYTISTSTGAATVLGDVGFASAGDLAFHDGTLYQSSLNNRLIKINFPSGVGTDVGDFGFSNVYGLANGDNNVLYGVANMEIFSVNTATGVGSLVSNFSGQGLLVAYGSAFFTESIAAVPEPSTIAGLGIGIVGAIGYGVRRR